MKRTTLRIILAVMTVLAITSMTACNKAESGKVGVVRNGGPSDSNSIRTQSGKQGVLCPDQSASWNGWGSDTHQYPASDQQRTFKFNDDKDADAPPIQGLRTSDGYKVTLRGTVYFKTAFDCTAEGIRLVKAFDQANYSRPDGQKPWEDFPGWLNNQWKPILDSTARDTLLSFQVKQVLSSAALLSGDPSSASKAVGDVNNKENVRQIEQALAEGLSSQLRTKLGDGRNNYFTDIVVNMEQPELPDIDDAIKTAQNANARVAEVRAERLKQQEQVRVEVQKRHVAAEKAKGYADCPSCARQDEARAFGKSLPSSVTTLVLGRGTGVNVGR